MDAKHFRKLIKKYQENTLPEKDRQLLDEWMNQLSKEELQESHWSDREIQQLHSRIINNITPKLAAQKRSVRILRYVSIAATIALITSYYFIFNPMQQKTAPQTEILAEQIFPATETPTLTLENGETIYLQQHKKQIKIDKNQLSYADGTWLSSPLSTNKKPTTLSLHVPKGSTYRVELEDGTLVYLNAASTIHYPTRFEDDTRTVQLEGEAYFEVSHQTYTTEAGRQAHRPFIVQSANQQVQVLGTQFQVEAYRNSPNTKTTLIDGSVAVQNKTGNRKQLKPRQQSLVVQGKPTIQLQEVDPDTVLDWKDNLFIFHNASLQQIMDKVSRWYDVRIDIQQWPTDRFYGEIKRNAPLSEILNMIQGSSKLKFKIITHQQERRLIML